MLDVVWGSLSVWSGRAVLLEEREGEGGREGGGELPAMLAGPEAKG